MTIRAAIQPPTIRLISIVFLSTLVTACYPVDECKNCSPPQEAIAEMSIHGVTLTTNTYPFPETLETSLESDSRYTTDTAIEYLTAIQTF